MITDMHTEHEFMMAQADCLETFERHIKRMAKKTRIGEMEFLHMAIVGEYGPKYSNEHVYEFLDRNFALSLNNQGLILNRLQRRAKCSVSYRQKNESLPKEIT